jgi:VanZ family protein
VSGDDETASGHDADSTQTGSSRRRWRLVAGSVAVGIVVASLLPPEAVLGPAPPTEPRGPFGLVGADTWLHAVGYAVLAGTLVPGGAADSETAPLRTFLVAVAVATGVGLGVELLQWPHPDRTASLSDAAANLVGAVVGAGAAVVLGRHRG